MPKPPSQAPGLAWEEDRHGLTASFPFPSTLQEERPPCWLYEFHVTFIIVCLASPPRDAITRGVPCACATEGSTLGLGSSSRKTDNGAFVEFLLKERRIKTNSAGPRTRGFLRRGKHLRSITISLSRWLKGLFCFLPLSLSEWICQIGDLHFSHVMASIMLAISFPRGKH